MPRQTINPIDGLMDRASEALVRTDYFACESLCLRALDRAVATADWERASRITLPLQEARRQRRQLALDAALDPNLDTDPPARGGPNGSPSSGSGGRAVLISALSSRGDAIRTPGFYLVQPPLVGAQAREIRLRAVARKVPAFVLCREPMTRAGRWPVVAVADARSASGGLGPVVLRTHVPPPPGAVFNEQGWTRDQGDLRPDAAWMLAASEALGDAAIARAAEQPIAAWRAAELLDALDALPDHEKLHQRLAEAFREALTQPPPPTPTPRRIVEPAGGF